MFVRVIATDFSHYVMVSSASCLLLMSRKSVMYIGVGRVGRGWSAEQMNIKFAVGLGTTSDLWYVCYGNS